MSNGDMWEWLLKEICLKPLSKQVGSRLIRHGEAVNLMLPNACLVHCLTRGVWAWHSAVLVQCLTRGCLSLAQCCVSTVYNLSCSWTLAFGFVVTVYQRSDLSPRPAQVRGYWVDVQAGVEVFHNDLQEACACWSCCTGYEERHRRCKLTSYHLRLQFGTDAYINVLTK